MRYPSLSRTNMRHRGPMESRKLNKTSNDILHDLVQLYKRLDEVKEETVAYNEEGRDGGKEMATKASLIRTKLVPMKGGDLRG